MCYPARQPTLSRVLPLLLPDVTSHAGGDRGFLDRDTKVCCDIMRYQNRYDLTWWRVVGSLPEEKNSFICDPVAKTEHTYFARLCGYCQAYADRGTWPE